MPRASNARVPSPLLFSVICAAVAFAAYANSLDNGFVWDDRIVLTRQLVAFRSVGDVLRPPPGIPQFSPDYYRPLTVASLLFDHALGGDRPFVYHLFVVLTHSLNAALVCWLAWHLFAVGGARSPGALAAGVLFAVHPVHTESVAWIAGRSDVLATAFLLATMIVHAGGRFSWPRTALAGVLTLAALTAKETAVTVFPLLMLLDYLGLGSAREALRVRLLRHTGPVVAAAIYLAARWIAIGGLGGHVANEPGLQRTAADLFGALGVYSAKLILAWPLNAYIDFLPTDAVSLGLIATVLSGLCGLAVWLWLRGSRLAVFLLAWIAVTLAPSLAIIWKIPEAPVAERYLYLPSVGFCLLLGFAVDRASVRSGSALSRGVIAATALLALIALFLTVSRNRVWHDDIALWTDAAAQSRTSGMPLRSLGTAYLNGGRTDDARRFFEQALTRSNSVGGLQVIHSNLGTIAMQTKDYAAARQHYEQALAVNPNAADVLFNLGLVRLEAGGRSGDAAKSALDLLLQAERLSPHDPDVHAAIGQALIITGDREQAAVHLRRALALGVRRESAAGIQAYLAGRASP